MRIIFILNIVLFVYGAGYAQTNTVKLSDINVPTSPAFVFTDKAPSSIEKPTDPKAFSLNLVNLFEGGAIEFTPYWFVNHLAYTFEDYTTGKGKFPIFSTFAISAATTKNDSGSSLSAGFRTQIVRILKKHQVNSLSSTLSDLLSVTPDKLDTNAIKQSLAAFGVIKSNPLFKLELAGAYLGKSSNNTYKTLAANKIGAWANLSFSPLKIPLNFVALARYSKVLGSVSKTGIDSSFLDIGASVSYMIKNFDLSAEYVNRQDFITKSNYTRFDFVANYQISESLTAVASFGKNFGNLNNIISLLGIKIGVSKEKVKS